jgi:hypothetical protein
MTVIACCRAILVHHPQSRPRPRLRRHSDRHRRAAAVRWSHHGSHAKHHTSHRQFAAPANARVFFLFAMFDRFRKCMLNVCSVLIFIIQAKACLNEAFACEQNGGGGNCFLRTIDTCCRCCCSSSSSSPVTCFIAGRLENTPRVPFIRGRESSRDTRRPLLFWFDGCNRVHDDDGDDDNDLLYRAISMHFLHNLH